MDNSKAPITLGTEKISKLLLQYAVPAIIAMTASSLYNMVDRIFIGQGVGALAISGLALTFPFMNLGSALGTLVGIGGSTLASMKLGQKDYETAQRVLGNVITLNALLGIVFTIIAIPLIDPVLYFFGASDQTIGYARDYMLIILIGNTTSHMYFGLNSMLRAMGQPRKAMFATILAVIINTALDPIFIYGFGWGIRGAAIATVLAQLISLGWQVWLFSRPDSLLRIRRGIYGLKRRIAIPSLTIGLAPFLMNVAACFVVILINQSLKRHGGDLAIGAYGIANSLAFIAIMIVAGFNQGMQPIAGYNFGAQLYDRVTGVLKVTIAYATIITSVGFLAGMFAPRLLVSIFTTDEELKRIAANALRIMVAAFPLVGSQMVISNFFQSIGMAGKAIFLSLTRQLLYLVPLLLILPYLYGLAGVWACLPTADVLAFATAAIMLAVQFKEFGKLKREN